MEQIEERTKSALKKQAKYAYEDWDTREKNSTKLQLGDEMQWELACRYRQTLQPLVARSAAGCPRSPVAHAERCALSLCETDAED